MLKEMDSLLDCQQYVNSGFQLRREKTVPKHPHRPKDTHNVVDTIKAHGQYVMKSRDLGHWCEVCMFKTFSEVGYQEAVRLSELAHEKATPKTVDPNVVFEVFRGQTILSLTYTSNRVYEAIKAVWEDKHLEPVEGDGEKEIENSAYRNFRFMLLYKPYLLRDQTARP